jgi:hypothetical protein
VVEEIFWEVNGALDTIWQGFSGFTNTVQRGAEAAKVKTDSNFISSISLFNIEKKKSSHYSTHNETRARATQSSEKLNWTLSVTVPSTVFFFVF